MVYAVSEVFVVVKLRSSAPLIATLLQVDQQVRGTPHHDHLRIRTGRSAATGDDLPGEPPAGGPGHRRHGHPAPRLESRAGPAVRCRGRCGVRQVSAWWSYALAPFGLVGMLLAGRRSRWGWMLSIFTQVLWLAYAIDTKQW